MSDVIHRGGCHCGRVRFEVDAPPDITAYDCNCSICRAAGFLHVFVSRPKFRLLSGQDDLVSYRFNTEVADHLFCRVCGIKSFYVPRSHPDGYSVNLRCLAQASIAEVRVLPFDGANWEASIHELPA